MIKFFRKIRYNLMETGKTGKYLKYAIGEIVLVVIGILIALSINNWNEEKKQRQIVNTYLSNYIEDIKDDISEYKSSQDEAVFKFHALQQLLKMVGEEPVKLHENEYVNPLTSDNSLWNKPLPNEPTQEFIDLCFLWSVRDVAPVVNKSTLNEMNATGTFSFIKNKSLKEAVNSYYYEIEWRFSESSDNYQEIVRNNWQESLLKSGVLAQDMTNVENPLDLIRSNTERIGYLRALIRTTWFRAESLDKVHHKALELIKLIEFEISD